MQMWGRTSAKVAIPDSFSYHESAQEPKTCNITCADFWASVYIYIYIYIATVGFMEEDTAGQHWPLSLGRILIAQRSTEACWTWGGEFASLVQSVLNMDLERVQELSDTGVSVNMALREARAHVSPWLVHVEFQTNCRKTFLACFFFLPAEFGASSMFQVDSSRSFSKIPELI